MEVFRSRTALSLYPQAETGLICINKAIRRRGIVSLTPYMLYLCSIRETREPQCIFMESLSHHIIAYHLVATSTLIDPLQRLVPPSTKACAFRDAFIVFDASEKNTFYKGSSTLSVKGVGPRMKLAS
jgi:hypothetical protein